MSLAPPSPSPLVPGYQLDRYELLCPIAEGGMAQVWIARLRGKHGFEKLVAIKTILPKYANDPHFQQMFLDEARIASGIEHTNVAHILDLGDEHGVLYLAMEWVDGDALTKLHRTLEKKGQKIPTGILLRVLADTCGGLHVAHELRGRDGALLGVVHRDVSPQNILVSSRGVAKLIDFGIAKARDRMAGETSTGLMKGKIQYMAPEQALGGALDRRADVWAIGAILYHYISGDPPFEGPNQLATLHRLTLAKPPKPLPPEVPPPVAHVVMRALTHDRDQRFATAAELQAALEQAMVESKLTTSTVDVAAFAEVHFADRAAKRREAIEFALGAAAERARVQEVLKPDADTSNSIAGAAIRVQAQVALAPLSDSKLPLTVLEDPGRALEVKIPAPPSVPTNATLERAALESPIAPAAPHGRILLLTAAVGVVGAIVGVIATSALRSSERQQPAAAATAVPSAVAVVAPTAPPPPPPATATGIAASVPSTSAAPPGTSVPVGQVPASLPRRPPPAVVPPRSTGSKIPQVIPNGF